MGNNKKVYNSIDLFKFIAAMLVVAVHTHPFANTGADYYFTCLCRIAVPFFFVATSYFFFRRPEPDIRAYTKRLGTIYVLWLLLELPWVYERFFVSFDHSFPLQILNIFRCLVFSNTWWDSWFIMASMIAVSMVCFLSRRCRWRNGSLLALAGVGYLISLTAAGYYGFADLFLNERMQFYHKAFTWCFCPANSFVVALIYVVIGKVLAESDWEKWRICGSGWKTALLLLLFFAIGFVEVHYMRWSVLVTDAWVFLPPLTMAGFVLLLQTDLKINAKFARWMRDVSILVYILHSIFQYANKKIFGMADGGAMFVWTVAESLACASLIILLSKKISFLKKLY